MTYKIASKTTKTIYAYGFTTLERAEEWLRYYRPGNWRAREPVENLEIIEDKGY